MTMQILSVKLLSQKASVPEAFYFTDAFQEYPILEDAFKCIEVYLDETKHKKQVAAKINKNTPYELACLVRTQLTGMHQATIKLQNCIKNAADKNTILINKLRKEDERRGTKRKLPKNAVNDSEFDRMVTKKLDALFAKRMKEQEK